MALDPSLAGFVQAGIPSAANVVSTLATNYANRRLAEYQSQVNWDQTMQMWNMTNKYNSPAAQMARYEEAGLNPYLIYGQSNATQQASVGTYQRPNLEAPRFDLLARKEQIEGMAWDNRLKSASFASQVLNLKYKNAMLLQTYLHNKKLQPYLRALKKLEYDLRDKTKENLEKKYKFENFFYDKNLNPYNNSLIGGSLNVGLNLLNWLSSGAQNIKQGLQEFSDGLFYPAE